MDNKQIETYIQKSITVKENVLKHNIPEILKACTAIKQCLVQGNTIYMIGNGGSAADAQHWAAEFVSRFLKERKALPAVALTTNTSVLTAIGNDYTFDKVFSRQIEAYVKKGDIVIAISTSGNSMNLIEGLHAAKKLGATTMTLLGNTGGNMKGLGDIEIIVSSTDTPHIQESHITIEHCIAKLVEEELSS